MAQTYINGSDLLLFVGGKAIGHCTTHTITFNTETKDRAVKPLASKGLSAGLWKEKGVTGLSISLKADGLRYKGETENGFEELSALWGAGTSIKCIAYPRGTTGVSSGDPTEGVYLSGMFVITSIEETGAAQDDATYTVSLENDGEPDIYPGKE